MTNIIIVKSLQGLVRPRPIRHLGRRLLAAVELMGFQYRLTYLS